ncbi:hypothetical protein E1N66_18800 [Pantoea allii]|nr:hypothetical protein [Pantoea allii]THB82853.1 hypothetical protein E1N66_18800 [Pantoea allii]
MIAHENKTTESELYINKLENIYNLYIKTYLLDRSTETLNRIKPFILAAYYTNLIGHSENIKDNIFIIDDIKHIRSENFQRYIEVYFYASTCKHEKIVLKHKDGFISIFEIRKKSNGDMFIKIDPAYLMSLLTRKG